MARTFRRSEDFAPVREAFAERTQARRERRREFEALGFDEPDAVSALPLFSDARRARARQAFGH